LLALVVDSDLIFEALVAGLLCAFGCNRFAWTLSKNSLNFIMLLIGKERLMY